jgi:histidine triad (HIT) family protein
MVAAGKIMRDQKLEGGRIVINDGEVAGQTVFHIHVHIIAGGKFDWPPGVSKL